MSSAMWPTRPAPPEEAALYRRAGCWRDEDLGSYLQWAAREFGEKVAVVDRARRVTFAEVAAQVERVAAAFAARGVGPGDVVSFQLPNWLEAIVVFHAAARLGAVANPIVPIYRAHELRFILRQARSKLVVVPGRFRGFDYAQLYQELAPELPDLRSVVVVGDGAGEGQEPWEGLLGERGGPAEPAAVDADQVLLLLYTSGTTAEPKGALHSHNTLVYDAHSTAAWFGLDDRDIVLMPSPLTHVTGVLCGITLPFLTGAAVVLQDVWDPVRALELITAEGATFTLFATPFLATLLDAARDTGTATPSLRYIGCGGADIPAELMQAATDRLGWAVRMYGATEAPSTTCTTMLDSVEARTATDGRWIPPTEGRILDDEGRETPPGTQGEIVWRGPDMFLGYLDPTLNDDAFTPDGFFRTGDLGAMDAVGYLTVRGRIKDVINRSGEKFSAHEIEGLLYSHPAVSEVAVVGLPDARTGERACAFVVCRPGSTLGLPDLDEFLTGRAVARQKIPEQLVLVDELPKTASGKIQKFVLRERGMEVAR